MLVFDISGVSRMKFGHSERYVSCSVCQSPSHGARELVCKHVSIVNTWLMDLCSIRCLVGAGFAPWHVADQSRDEVFMAAQESVGAHRDSQGKIQRPATFIFFSESQGTTCSGFNSC